MIVFRYICAVSVSQTQFFPIVVLAHSLSPARICANFQPFKINQLRTLFAIFCTAKITTFLFSCDCALFDQKNSRWGGRNSLLLQAGIYRYKSFKTRSFAEPIP